MIFNLTGQENPYGVALKVEEFKERQQQLGSDEMICARYHELKEKADEATPDKDLGELDGVGPKYQELLHAAGINSVHMLSSEAPADLLEKLNTVNLEKSITKRPPTLENVKAWINLANE